MARDGSLSILELAKRVCQLVNTFGPLIERNYPDNDAIQAALEWARVACTIVPALQDELLYGPPADPVGNDPAEWPGTDPLAPAPVLPEPE